MKIILSVVAILHGHATILQLDPKVGEYADMKACERAGFQLTHSLSEYPDVSYEWGCLPSI